MMTQFDKLKQEITDSTDPAEIAGFLDGMRFAAQVYCKANCPDEVICDKERLMDVTVQGLVHYFESEVDTNAVYTAMRKNLCHS